MKQPPISNNYILNRVRGRTTERPQDQAVQRENHPSFDQILDRVQKKDDAIKISKHAAQRLNERKIDLTESDMKALAGAIDQARDKGVRDALIIKENAAFIANVQNRTIVTAVTEEQMQQNVFTNIDGAVIL